MHCTWAELMGRQIKATPANDEVFLTRISFITSG
jgi:hypothetical protein